MKKQALLFMLLVTWFGQAQKNVFSFDITTGISEDGIASLTAFNWHLNKKHTVQTSFMWNIAEDYLGKYKIPYHEYNLQFAYKNKIIRFGKYNRANIYLGGGGLIGLELINNGRKALYNGAEVRQQSKLIYGLFFTSSAEFHIANDVYLTLYCNEYLHINSDLGYFINYLGMGIRYYLLN